MTSKWFGKLKRKKTRPNQLIRNAAENMNKTVSAKCRIAPENMEEKCLDPKDGKYFQEVLDFMRLKKIQNNKMRVDKYNQKFDRRKNTLRSPLNIGEKVLVLAEWLKKKTPLENFSKVELITFPFSIETGFLQFIKRLDLTMILIYIG